MSAAFTPARVEGLRGRIAEHVDGYLAPHRATGRIELVADLAHPLPAVVIAEMAGFPVEDRERFRDWTYRINSFFFQSGTADPVAAEDANAAVVEARTWIHGLLEERRAHPKDDLLTALVAAEYEGGRLTEAELLSTAITLFLGGHDTTTQLIALGMSALVRHPDQLALLRERPDLVPAAVEEMLRYDAPFQMNLRYVTEDVELGGRTLRAGDLVRQALGSGSRDPDRFEEPDAFRHRAAARPSSELRAGPSLLLGAPLARLQAQVAVEALVGQLPGLRLDPASDPRPDVRPDITSRGLRTLRLAFDSTRPEACWASAHRDDPEPYRPDMPTIGLLSDWPPVEPKKSASPKVKMPPSDGDQPVAVARWASAAMPTIGLLSGWPPVEPKNAASPKAKMPPSEATSQ